MQESADFSKTIINCDQWFDSSTREAEKIINDNSELRKTQRLKDKEETAKRLEQEEEVRRRRENQLRKQSAIELLKSKLSDALKVKIKSNNNAELEKINNLNQIFT
mgnify:CR=1 FL=1